MDEEMTDLQFKTLINSIIKIIEHSETKEIAIKEIEALISKD